MERSFFERIARYAIWAMWVLLVLGSTLWLLVGAVAYWVRNGWLPGDSAGWAQAIGAVVAIVVAIAIPYYQNYMQLRQREDSALKQRLDGMNATYALMNHVAENYKRLKSVLLHNRKWADPERQSVAHDLKQSAAMLREIPVTALSNEMVHFLVALREVSNFGEFMAEKLTQYPEPIILLEVVNKVRANAALIDRWKEELDLLEQDARSTS